MHPLLDEWILPALLFAHYFTQLIWIVDHWTLRIQILIISSKYIISCKLQWNPNPMSYLDWKIYVWSGLFDNVDLHLPLDLKDNHSFLQQKISICRLWSMNERKGSGLLGTYLAYNFNFFLYEVVVEFDFFRGCIDFLCGCKFFSLGKVYYMDLRRWLAMNVRQILWNENNQWIPLLDSLCV